MCLVTHKFVLGNIYTIMLRGNILYLLYGHIMFLLNFMGQIFFPAWKPTDK